MKREPGALPPIALQCALLPCSRNRHGMMMMIVAAIASTAFLLGLTWFGRRCRRPIVPANWRLVLSRTLSIFFVLVASAAYVILGIIFVLPIDNIVLHFVTHMAVGLGTGISAILADEYLLPLFGLPSARQAWNCRIYERGRIGSCAPHDSHDVQAQMRTRLRVSSLWMALIVLTVVTIGGMLIMLPKPTTAALCLLGWLPSVGLHVRGYQRTAGVFVIAWGVFVGATLVVRPLLEMQSVQP